MQASGISVIVMILKGIVNSIEKEQAESFSTKMTYYGEKINIVLIKKSSYCFARFRLLFGWGIYSVQENPIDAFLIYQKSGYCFTGGWVEAR
jgi:hypothetical protein